MQILRRDPPTDCVYFVPACLARNPKAIVMVGNNGRQGHIMSKDKVVELMRDGC